MNLIPIDIDTIRIGHRLAFSLRSSKGTLLAQKGFLVESKEYLVAMVGSGVDLFVDVAESDAQRRAYVGKLYELVQEDKPLGQIAEMNLSSGDLEANRSEGDDTPDWLDIQVQANAILRDHNPEHFSARLDRLQAQVNRYAKRNPDGTLFALIHLSCTELALYSATHALLVGVMCSLAAREVLGWPPELEATLCKAALSMNINFQLMPIKTPPNDDLILGSDINSDFKNFCTRNSVNAASALCALWEWDTLGLDKDKDPIFKIL